MDARFCVSTASCPGGPDPGEVPLDAMLALLCRWVAWRSDARPFLQVAVSEEVHVQQRHPIDETPAVRGEELQAAQEHHRDPCCSSPHPQRAGRGADEGRDLQSLLEGPGKQYDPPTVLADSGDGAGTQIMMVAREDETETVAGVFGGGTSTRCRQCRRSPWARVPLRRVVAFSRLPRRPGGFVAPPPRSTATRGATSETTAEGDGRRRAGATSGPGSRCPDGRACLRSLPAHCCGIARSSPGPSGPGWGAELA